MNSFKQTLKLTAALAALVLMTALLPSCGSSVSETDNAALIPTQTAAPTETETDDIRQQSDDAVYTVENVIAYLGSVTSVTESAVLEPCPDTDPEGFISAVYFTDSLITDIQPAEITLDSASLGGGCIEIYTSSTYANARSEYLASPEGRAVLPCLHTVRNNTVIRISEYLTVYNAIKLESEILAAFDNTVAVPTVFSPTLPISAPETTAPAPETTAPAPETTAPAPETTAPAPETTAPAPETTAPAPETTAPTPETTAPAPETTAAERMVWIPKSGTKYHSKASCSGMKSPAEITLTEAEARGFTPCKRCH